MLRARFLTKRDEPRAQRAIAVGDLGNGGGSQNKKASGSLKNRGLAVERSALNRRILRRRRRGAPSWSRAGGIAGRDDAARAGQGVRKDRGRAWIAVRPDR